MLSVLVAELSKRLDILSEANDRLKARMEGQHDRLERLLREKVFCVSRIC